TIRKKKKAFAALFLFSLYLTKAVNLVCVSLCIAAWSALTDIHPETLQRTFPPFPTTNPTSVALVHFYSLSSSSSPRFPISKRSFPSFCFCAYPLSSLPLSPV
ncbi:hypothetical protein DFJ73DRAFT_867109, partial [Zopfochytrium polystomum]